MLFLWESDDVWPEGSVPAFLDGAGSMFQPSGAALWDVCAHPCGETRGSSLVMAGEKEADVTAVSNLPCWQRGGAEPQAMGKGICCSCKARKL